MNANSDAKPSPAFASFVLNGGKELAGCKFVFEVLDITVHHVVVRPRILTEDPDVFIDYGPHVLAKFDKLVVATVSNPIEVHLKVSTS